MLAAVREELRTSLAALDDAQFAAFLHELVAALSQVELLDAVARLMLEPDAHAEDLIRAACDDMRAVMARASGTVWPCGQRLASRWTPFPATGR